MSPFAAALAVARLLSLLGALAETERVAHAIHADDVSYTFTSPWPAPRGAPVCTVLVWTNGDPRARVNVDYTSVYLTDDLDPWGFYIGELPESPCASVDAEVIRANVLQNNAD